LDRCLDEGPDAHGDEANARHPCQVRRIEVLGEHGTHQHPQGRGQDQRQRVAEKNGELAGLGARGIEQGRKLGFISKLRHKDGREQRGKSFQSLIALYGRNVAINLCSPTSRWGRRWRFLPADDPGLT
jgi:hypothetical protein